MLNWSFEPQSSTHAMKRGSAQVLRMLVAAFLHAASDRTHWLRAVRADHVARVLLTLSYRRTVKPTTISHFLTAAGQVVLTIFQAQHVELAPLLAHWTQSS